MSQCTKPDALRTQEGGDHYSKLTIQPVEFVMANRWDFCAGSICKYVTRHQSKNHRQDLEKAKHFIDLRKETVGWWASQMATYTIDISAYCKANALPVEEARVLEALSDWVHSDSDRFRLELLVAMDHLIYERYGKPLNHDEFL